MSSNEMSNPPMDDTQRRAAATPLPTVSAAPTAAISASADERTVAEVRRKLEGKSGRDYWRSLDELADTGEFKEFLDSEFPRQAAPLENSLDRRDFMKLLGASLALAGLTACARPPLPNEKIMPYVEAPEEIVPGTPLFYASAILDGGYAEGVLVESHQGRPTKVEGNPDHPASLGATHAITQATILSLYDPDRSDSVRQDGQRRTWGDFQSALTESLDGLDDGAGLRIVTEPVTSPTLAKQLSDLLARYPGARWVQYDAAATTHAIRGAEHAFGRAAEPVYDFGAADVVLSLDADFTNEGPGRLRYARDFARKRRVRSADDSMNRLWQVESIPSPTGSISDHRLPLGPGEIAGLAAWLAGELGVDGPSADRPEHVDAAWAEALLEDLEAHRGTSIVVAGPSQPPVVHALAHAINDALGNVGSTVRYVEPALARVDDYGDSLRELAADLTAGAVDVLVVIGANPAYTAPAELDFASAMSRAGSVFHVGQSFDETAARATWHAPEAHHLEAWSDARAFDGTASILQPLIRPFYGGASAHEVLATMLGDPDASDYDVVRAYWRERAGGDFDAFWRQAVYRGTIPGTESATLDVARQPIDADLPADGELTVLFRADPSVGDGRWANNGWLQELPKPFTKLTWDNAALLAPSTAAELGVANEDHVTVSVGGRSLEAPAWILPGQAPGTVALHLGYGRAQAGRIGTGIGVDASLIRPSAEPFHAVGSIAVASGSTRLSDTQTHHDLNGTGERRHIVRHGTLAELQAHPEHPEFVHPVPHAKADLYDDYIYESYAWGMVIDMTVCTGCNACVTACQSENNVPIVGKEQVRIGREMHWIRVDHYYRGDADNPEQFHMPMACQHCEKAPCEPVCPVGATVHDHEGLNVMVYNRCVGTRYCSNNCPYKVRRFNFLQYAQLPSSADELSLAQNPDVTSRGVMEKCTYCTQRISQARITANNEERAIRDGEVVTACQAACPTEAIVFGDTNDPNSAVTAAKGSVLNYKLLEELNTVPRTTYLAKVTNPHPALAGAQEGAH